MFLNRNSKILATCLLGLSLAACDDVDSGAGGATSAASSHTQAHNQNVAADLPLAAQRDFEDAARGFIARDDDLVIKDDKGNVVWDMTDYAFIEGTAPDTVNPSLWRQAKLHGGYGLFQVADGVYQVRGYDLSNMTIIDGDEGRIIIDPLTSIETARAAYALVNRALGERPLKAVIYTHSHMDHFGGAAGVLSPEDLERGDIDIIAPLHFMKEATSENLLAGIAMARRGTYMFGMTLPRSAEGHVETGLGKNPARGGVSLIAPTVIIAETGKEMTIAGVRLQFQYSPDTEAPAVLTLYLPEKKVYLGADNLTRTMHNFYTLRGAKVRDSLKWSAYIRETISFADGVEVIMNSHSWPLWGNAECVDFLTKQADLYRFIHDQTLRYANKGYTPKEIAEELELPSTLANDFSMRGYYGTLKHNAKAVYQLYYGWYDGNPANLDPLPPVEEAKLMVAAMGGEAAVVAKGLQAYDAGDYRWAATLLNKAVFANPESGDAKRLLASIYEQMGYQAESGLWRDIYLTGALELRNGVSGSAVSEGTATGFLSLVPLDQFFMIFGTMLDAKKADGERLSVVFHFTDLGETHVLNLRNSVLQHERGESGMAGDVAITLTHEFLMNMIGGQVGLSELVQSDDFNVDGSLLTLGKFLSMFDRPQMQFNIVTP